MPVSVPVADRIRELHAEAQRLLLVGEASAAVPLQDQARQLEVGVSPATLSRVERGDYLPGRDNLLKLAAWLGEAIVALDVGPSGHEGEPESTPDAVALHLRADKNLSDAEAGILDEVFRSAYAALRRRRPDPAG